MRYQPRQLAVRRPERNRVGRIRGHRVHQARVVDLDPATTVLLVRHSEKQALERGEFGPSYDDRELVVCSEDGTSIHPQSFSQGFTRAVAQAGLRKIRLHDLCHTHATIPVKVGVPVKVIIERLGHESPAFTLKQYAHVVPGRQAEAAELIPRLWRCEGLPVLAQMDPPTAVEERKRRAALYWSISAWRSSLLSSRALSGAGLTRAPSTGSIAIGSRWSSGSVRVKSGATALSLCRMRWAFEHLSQVAT